MFEIYRVKNITQIQNTTQKEINRLATKDRKRISIVFEIAKFDAGKLIFFASQGHQFVNMIISLYKNVM